MNPHTRKLLRQQLALSKKIRKTMNPQRLQNLKDSLQTVEKTLSVKREAWRQQQEAKDNGKNQV